LATAIRAGPSAGLHAKFPHYDYDDMVQAQYLLLIQGLKREPSAAGDGYIHGLHAFVGMAGNLYGLDGRNGLHHQRSRLPMLLPKLLPERCTWHSFSVPAWQNNQADRSLN